MLCCYWPCLQACGAGDVGAVQIVFAGLLGLLVFSHTPDAIALVGIAIICLGGLAAAWQSRPTRDSLRRGRE